MRLKPILTILFILSFFQISFAQEKKYISTLHQLDSILKTNYNLMKQININDIDMLMVNDCKLNEVETTLESLKFENIAGYIDFKKREEIAIYEYFTEITTQTAQLRVIMDQYISNLDFWYYKKAVEYLAKSDTINAIEKLEKSLLVNPFYVPSLYQKAMLYLNSFKTDSASKIAQYVALNIYPKENDLLLIRAMNEQINEQFKNRGNKMLAAEYCNESLEIFIQADTFCKYFNSNDCAYFKNGITQSKYGLYRSYLRVAEQAMDAQKYSIAETFVMKAKEYAEKNRDIINNDDETDKFLKRIITKYIDLSMFYKRNVDYTQSGFYFEKASSLCQIIKDKECETLLKKKEKEVLNTEIAAVDNNTTIPSEKTIVNVKNKHTKKSIKTKKLKKNKKVKKTTKKTSTLVLHAKQKTKIKNKDYNVYCSLIETGDEFSNAAKYEQAIEKYQAAKDIEKTALSKPNLVLDSLINATAYNIIHSQLQTASFLIWADKLTQADTAYQFCVSLQRKYHLENDRSTNALLNSFRKKIELKACQNIQDEIEGLNGKTTSYIAIKDFAKAQILIDEAKNLINKHNNCELSSTKTDKLLELVKPVTDYYHLKETAKANYEKADYKLFAESYYNADKLYLQAKLDTLGIPNNNIIAYLDYQSNEQAILYAANYFIEFYNFENCLAALKLLKNKGVEANKTKDIQITLAQKQAKTDRMQQAVFVPNKNIIKYTGNDKWFRYFNSEYK